MPLNQDTGRFPVPMENVPQYGTVVRIQGKQSVLTADRDGKPFPFLRHNEQMMVKFSPHIKQMIEHGWADLIDYIEYPAASQYFPTMADVLEMIDDRAKTLPGESVLGIKVDGDDLVMIVGRDADVAHEVRATLPQFVEMSDQVADAELAADRAETAFENVMALVKDAAQYAADQVTIDAEKFSALSAAAAERSMAFAEEARRTVDEIGTIEGPPGPAGPEGPRGATGQTGATGPAGPAGPQGEQGEPGADGRDGASVSYEGMVAAYSDLPQGLTAKDKGKGWVVTADGRIYVWDGSAFPASGAAPEFRGPKGDTGPRGPQGIQGIQGPSGATGPTGPKGDRGDTGAAGPAGPKGDTGQQGVPGPKGDTGLPGRDGRGLIVRGQVSSSASLPPSAAAGDTYVLLDSGRAVMWNGSAWSDPFQFVGPKGDQGDRGLRGAVGPTGPVGPAGADGKLSSDQAVALFGSSSYTSKPYGTLTWTGPQYSPTAESFTRLRRDGDGRLTRKRDYGNVAQVNDDFPCLVAPVSGWYHLFARQTWATIPGAKGCGLGGSLTDGQAQMFVWQDIPDGQVCTASGIQFLNAGQRLYPWIWATQTGSNMNGIMRGMPAEYSLLFLSGA